MQTTFKRIIVYDLETGGLDFKINSITEMAGVAIDVETLEIIEEFSVMFRPRLDLVNVGDDSRKEARNIFKQLAIKDDTTNIKTLHYKGTGITLKTLDSLTEDLKEFRESYLEGHGNIISYEDYLKLKETEFSEIIEILFNYVYNPKALEITHINRELLLEEGVEYEEGFKEIQELIQRHTIGNSKPIMAGHNIGWLPRRIVRKVEKGPNGFDNPFMEKLFWDNDGDFFDMINDKIIDTLVWARIKWFELPSFSLGICANAVGLTLKEAHRALPDTIANAKFLIKMLQNLRGEGTQESTYVRRKFSFNF